MTRKTKLAAAALAAAAVLIAFLWHMMKAADDAPGDAANGQGAAPTADGQTPAVRLDGSPQQGGTDRGDAPTSKSQLSFEKTADADPYQFENWEDAANALAELVGLEFDAARKEQGIEADDLSLALEAYQKVRKAVFEDKENPALLDALQAYLPRKSHNSSDEWDEGRIPVEKFTPLTLLVRAGRLSPQVLKIKTTLPNGEVYYSDPKEDIAMTWRREIPPNASALAAAKRFETALAALERRLAHTPDDEQIQKRAASLRAAIKELKTPRYERFEAFAFSGDDPTHPDYKVTFMDLGVLK